MEHMEKSDFMNIWDLKHIKEQIMMRRVILIRFCI